MTGGEDPGPASEPEKGQRRRKNGWGRFDQIIRTALIIIPLGVIGNVIFSFLYTDRGLLQAVANFPRGYLALALLLTLVPWFTNTLRMMIWIRFLGHRIGFLDTLRIVLASDLGAAISPTAVGSSLFKWGLLIQRGVSPGAAASLATLTPLEDGLFFALALPLAVLLTASWGHPAFGAAAHQIQSNALPALALLLGIALLSWFVVRLVFGGGLGRRVQYGAARLRSNFRKRLRASWIDARHVFRTIIRRGKGRFVLTMVLTGVQWIARYSVISALIAFLGAPVQPILFWVLQWVVFTLSAFIPTPGAVGGAEAAFLVIYAPFLPSEVIGLATAGWRFFTFYLLLLLAAVLYLALSRIPARSPSA